MGVAHRSMVFALAALLALVTISGAAYVAVTEPFSATLHNGGSIYLGKVGPGQTFYVIISSDTTNSSGTMINRGWNQFVVYGLPGGWIGVNSSLNTQYLAVRVTPSPSAPNGLYNFSMRAVNIGNTSGLGNLTFSAAVNVTPNVFELDVYPQVISIAPGQPAVVHVTINNTGVSDSPFLINSSGLPAWNSTLEEIALHGKSSNFNYTVYENTSGTWNLNVRVVSTESPLVYKETNVTLEVGESVLSDYGAIGDGAVAFPIIYEPVYAIMYLINGIIKSV